MMTLEQAVRTRRSVRGFLPDPVPDAILEAALELAQQAPSNCNVQPWVAHLVSGPSLRALSDRMVGAALAGTPANPDWPGMGRYPEPWRARQIDAAVQLYGAMGIGRHDTEGRNRAALRNLECFDAPHALFLFLPEAFGIHEAVDLGIYAQTLMLALTARGVGSCAQGALGRYPDIVRNHLGLGAENRLLFGIAFGFEDTSVAANAARVGRATAVQAVVRHG